MIKPRSLLVAFAVALLFSVQTSAFTPERSLENPLFLSEIGREALFYGAWSPQTERYLLAYGEYDWLARGHGAFIFQIGQEEEADIFSFIGTKEQGDALFGFAVHRFFSPVSEWLVDLAAAYRVRQLVGRIGVHSIPIADLKGIQERSKISIGTTLSLNDSLSLGVDAWPLEQQYDGFVAFALDPAATARVNLRFSREQLDQVGIDFWYRRERILAHFAYTLGQNWDGTISFGMGFKF